MNVDKFGHYIHKRLRLSELLELNDNALTKSENGNFDLKTSRLKGLSFPLEADEAVSKGYVDQSREKLVVELNGVLANRRPKILAEAQNKTEITIKAEISKVLTHLENNFYSKADIDKLFQLPKHRNV